MGGSKVDRCPRRPAQLGQFPSLTASTKIVDNVAGSLLRGDVDDRIHADAGSHNHFETQ